MGVTPRRVIIDKMLSAVVLQYDRPKAGKKPGSLLYKCKQCCSLISTTGATTSNLGTPLKRRHPVIHTAAGRINTLAKTPFPTTGISQKPTPSPLSTLDTVKSKSGSDVKKWHSTQPGQQQAITSAFVSFVART